MKNLAYNYIFIAPDQADINIMYSDLNKTSHTQHIARYYPGIKSKILRLFHRLHMSKMINSFIPLPLKSIWNNKAFGFSLNPLFDKNIPCCFIVYARYFEQIFDNARYLFIEYLRNKYKKCKIVMYYGDLIKSFTFDLNLYRHYFDNIFSFDKKESEINGFIYCEEPFSFYPIEKNTSIPQSDITFIGSAKDRLKDILSVFEILSNHNIKCDFYITGVTESEKMYSDKIIYNTPLDFKEVLQHVVSSKCILEVMQHDGSSATTRISEAICYKKKILSNCRELTTKSYYNQSYIHIYTNPNDIDISFITKDIDNIDYKYMENLSPLKMIETIDDEFKF
jgi:hypothetical protein